MATPEANAGCLTDNNVDRATEVKRQSLGVCMWWILPRSEGWRAGPECIGSPFRPWSEVQSHAATTVYDDATGASIVAIRIRVGLFESCSLQCSIRLLVQDLDLALGFLQFRLAETRECNALFVNLE